MLLLLLLLLRHCFSGHWALTLTLTSILQLIVEGTKSSLAFLISSAQFKTFQVLSEVTL